MTNVIIDGVEYIAKHSMNQHLGPTHRRAIAHEWIETEANNGDLVNLLEIIRVVIRRRWFGAE
jgi:hypothetical protein